MIVPGNPWSAGRDSWRALAVLVAEALVGFRSPALAGVPAGMLTESIHSRMHSPSQTSPSVAGSTGLSTSNDSLRQKIPGGPDGSAPPLVTESGDVDGQHAEVWTLVRAVQDGDGEAFGKLYDRYVDQVFRFILYRVNDRSLAEDFTSETFLRALRRISTINYQGRDIGAWFMTIARNIVFDHTKSARFRLELTTAETVETVEVDAGPEAAVLAHLTNTRLLSAVNELGDEQKECIVLRFLHGLSVSETAAVMGKNDGAIKALQHRAVKRLASMLADELR
ncbi:MAG: sigma-70 family RNA polymerase sigma factor [Jatrophihabitantaceae bacterium]